MAKQEQFKVVPDVWNLSDEQWEGIDLVLEDIEAIKTNLNEVLDDILQNEEESYSINGITDDLETALSFITSALNIIQHITTSPLIKDYESIGDEETENLK